MRVITRSLSIILGICIIIYLHTNRLSKANRPLKCKEFDIFELIVKNLRATVYFLNTGY